MSGELFRYQIIVPLLYEPYDVHSVDPDSEAVFVLDAPVSMSWVRQTEQSEIEETVAGELHSREDGMFELELRYLYAISKAEVRRNVNLHSFQPHLYIKYSDMKVIGLIQKYIEGQGGAFRRSVRTFSGKGADDGHRER